MILVLAKLLICPVLLATSTLVVQRWGTVAGGLMLGLPLISGPVSVLLSAEYGPTFAVQAAHGTLLGFVAAGAACAAYAFVAAYRPWWQSLAISLTAFVVAAAALSSVEISTGWLLALSPAFLGLLALAIDAPVQVHTVRAPRKRTLALRMGIASGLVLLVTTSAQILGAEVSGFLAPLPILATIMAVASHRQSGSTAVQGLLRGAVFGSWGGVAFFSTVVLLMGAFGPLVTYAMAAVAALLAGAAAMEVQMPSLDERHEDASAHMPVVVLAAIPCGIR